MKIKNKEINIHHLVIEDITPDDELTIELHFKNQFFKGRQLQESTKLLQIYKPSTNTESVLNRKLFIIPEHKTIESGNKQGSVWFEMIENFDVDNQLKT